MIESCRNCAHLTYCETVDEGKLESRFRCDTYSLAAPTEVAANKSVTNMFGAWALGYDNSRLQDKKSKARSTNRKRR